jgi:hypothetical protein
MTRNARGQATTEYILLLSALVSFFVTVSGLISRMQIPKKMVQMISGPFLATYQYGHPKVKGPDNGGPIMHPRIVSDGNFRIFFGTESQ